MIIPGKIPLILCVLLSTMAIFGCEEEKTIPKGFEVVANDKFAHFIYVVGDNNINDKLAQRVAGMTICEKFNQMDYCDIYMWSDRSKVATKLPIMNQSTIIGMYTIRDGKSNLKPLWNNKHNEKEWYERGLGGK